MSTMRRSGASRAARGLAVCACSMLVFPSLGLAAAGTLVPSAAVATAIHPALHGPGQAAQQAAIDALARTLAQLPPDQAATLSVSVFLLPRPRLVETVSAEDAALAARGREPAPAEALALRREYALPPTAAEARSAALERAIDDLRKMLDRSSPDADVRLGLSLNLSSPPWAGAGRDSGIADYLSRVRALIDRRKAYPSIARQLRLQGRVLLRALIRADGTLGGLTVLASAGGALDKAALLALRRAGPFPSPGELGLDSVSIEVPISYVLE